MIYKEQVHHTAPSQTLLFSFFAAENLNMFINSNQFQPNRTDAVCSISRNRIFAVIDTLIGTSDFYFLFIEFPSQNTYNAELRGICNYYCMASNYASLNYFSYLMEYSCLKTLSAKARRSLRKTVAAYKDGHGKWGIPYETKTGKKRMYFANWQKCRKEASACNDTINDVFMMHNHNRNSLEARLKAKVCELCGTTQGELFELHHVRKVKDLNGKERWEQCMIAKRRKTLVVCKPCHNAIHHGSKSQ